MQPPAVLDLKSFVPAKDYELCQQFFVDLGFTRNWSDVGVAEFQIGSFRFLLQNYFVKDFAEHYMMHLMVESTDDWWNHIQNSGLAAKYPMIKAKPPELQSWGLKVLFLIDPSGVLWHIAERSSA